MAHSTENTSGYITLPATAAALTPGLRVNVDSSGNVSAAGVSGGWIGATIAAVAASGNATIRLRNSTGTYQLQAAGAITKGSRLFAAASGQVSSSTSSGDPLHLVALEAAGAQGDIIQCAPMANSGAGVIAVPLQLAAITSATTVNALIPGFSGTITAIQFSVTTAVTTGAKLATLSLKVNAAAVTGGAVALTSANCTPIGALIAGSAITGANTFLATDTINVVSSSVTAFAEGQGNLFISYVTN
jgi:hypothetical protein